MSKQIQISRVVSIVFRGVALAMGIASAVLNLLQAATPQVTGILLGIGLFVLALDALDKEDNS